MVDAKNILKNLTEQRTEAQQQIAIADRILINKIDLVDEKTVEQVSQNIQKLNNFATIFTTTKSNINLDYILNIHGYDQNRALEIDEELQNIIQKTNEDHHDHDHGHMDHEEEHQKNHLASIKTFSLYEESPIDKEKFVQWLAKLFWNEEYKFDVLRMKGILNVANTNNRVMLQGVHDIFDLIETEIPWGLNEQRYSKIVFIGRNLDMKIFAEKFKLCT